MEAVKFQFLLLKTSQVVPIFWTYLRPPKKTTTYYGAIDFMAKSKDVRVTIALECTSCTGKETGAKSTGISRYTTRKNHCNTPTRLESKKYCSCCQKHTNHKELKK